MERNRISTHTPLAGRDVAALQWKDINFDFYSHAPRGARHSIRMEKLQRTIISTHTPLAGRDRPVQGDNDGQCQISTHTPLAGRDAQC